jgi:two-component system invasion response regulator UvrY
VNILIVDDHAIVRAGLTRLLRSELEAEIREAATGRAAVALARGNRFDLVILDLGLPELGGLELLSRLLQASPAPILVLSMHAEPLYVSRTLAAGAQGYMSKNASPEELLNAVRKVAGGGRYIEAELAQALALAPASAPQTLDQLSARDLEILRLLGGGASLSEVAEALGLGYKTIANNCTQIKARLGVRRTADLVRVALEAGVVR